MQESGVKETLSNGSFSFLDRRTKQGEGELPASQVPGTGRPLDLLASSTLLVIEVLGSKEPWFSIMVELPVGPRPNGK